MASNKKVQDQTQIREVLKSKLSLAQYVKKRNGVPLGASGSSIFSNFLALLEPNLGLLLIAQCYASTCEFSSNFVSHFSYISC